MTEDAASTAAPVDHTRWQTAAAVAGLGILLMALLGGLAVPYSRFILHALYGIVERTALHPFGIALPGTVTFALVNLAVLATSLSAGRRVGAILAHRSVEGQLGSPRVMSAVTWIAGAAGAATFAVTTTWPTPAAASATSPLEAVIATLADLLHVAVLVVGPARGAFLFFRATPYCHRCWVWMQHETGGGSFAGSDLPRLKAALAAGDYADLGDLPVADRHPRAPSYALNWWECPSCHAQAFVTLVSVEPDGSERYLSSGRATGPAVAQLHSLIAHRREFAQARTPTP